MQGRSTTNNRTINNNTAILIFARSASEDAAHKPFRKSVGLFEELNRQTLQKAVRTGLPYFLSSEKEQEGATFGARFTNAIKAVYGKGYDNVIAIGNDTPHLSTAQLLDTASKLRDYPLILGPSADGGFYLMGMHRSQFDADTFLKLPWQTSRLTRSISRLLTRNKKQAYFLETLTDIDTTVDVDSLISADAPLSRKLKKLLVLLMGKAKPSPVHDNATSFCLLFPTRYNKGSPQPILV